MDRAQPPVIGARPQLAATPEEGPALARSLKTSVQASKSEVSRRGKWDLNLRLVPEEIADEEETFYLRVREQGRRPQNFERYVIDMEREKRLLVTRDKAEVRPSQNDPSRRLRVIVETQSFAEQNSGGASLRIGESELRTNAPNPFTEATTIAYQLAEETDVRIAIYDILGRPVEVVFEGRREPGLHQLT